MATLTQRLRSISKLLSRARHQIRQADRARDMGDHARAAELYARALHKVPDNGAIHIQAGHMFKESGDIASAERHYLHALALVPEDQDAHLQLAHLYKNSHRPQQAYAHFLRLAELAPDQSRQDLELAQRTLGIEARPKADVPPGGALTIEVAAASGLIDRDWYRRQYPDIGSTDPLTHFMGNGRFELRQPGPGFDPHWYLRTYPQVLGSGLDPFSHYLSIGQTRGMKPVGPAPYQRWIEAYDTFDGEDERAIAAHISDAELVEPAVLVAVDIDTIATIDRAIHSLRVQWLKPRLVYLCVADGSPPTIVRTLQALVGSDSRFRIVDAGHPIEDDVDDASVVLIDAAVELREHALYMMVQAATADTALVYADHDRIDDEGCRHSPVFKPAASPELLRQVDYVGPCGLLPGGTPIADIAHSLVSGGESLADIIRSAALATTGMAIVHVPFVLYHDHAERSAPPSPPGPRLADADLPTVTVIIPTRDRLDLLRPCIDSLRSETDYPLDRIDIVVVDNGSTEDETIDWLATEQAAGHLRALHAPIPFNYPVLNNMAAEVSSADVLVLLNNDTEVQDPEWLRGLVGYAMQPDVGAVGPMLLYDDGTIQHAGIVLGVGGVAAHAHCGIAHDAPGALGLAQRTHEVAAVTGACLAIRREVFEEIGGLDKRLPVAFNDVLLCLGAVSHGYRNLYVHDVWLRHYESKTRGRDDTIAKVKIFNREARYAREAYPALFRNDPWYSPNLSFDLPELYEPAFPPRVTRPWRPFKRDRQAPRVLLLSATLDQNTEIGTAVALQARYLVEHGYSVQVGAPYWMLSRGSTLGSHVPLDSGREAAAHAVAWDADVIVAHTSNFGDVSRWLGTSPPVLLHYHGARAEAASGVAGHVHEKEARLLALPFVAQVLTDSADARDELSLADAVIQPPGADRLGLWTSRLIPLRDDIRRNRDWTNRIVVLVESATGTVSAKVRQTLDGLIPELDATTVSLVLWTNDLHPASNLPDGMTAVAPANAAERQSLMIGADIFWPLDEGSAPLDAIEAGAMGLMVFGTGDLAVRRSPKALARALAGAAQAAGVPDTWSRRAICHAGWAETLDHFERLLSDLHGLATTKPGRAMLSPQALIVESGLFDLEYYYAHNADVVGHDGFRHFVENGCFEGRPFSKLFDVSWYLEQYPDARQAVDGPFLEYLRSPQGLRDPNPFFSNAAYLEALGDQDTGGRAPLAHYLHSGAAAGLSVGDAFDGAYYTAVYPDVAASGLSPLVHFLTVGQAEGRLPKWHEPAPVDLFDDADVIRVTGRSIERSIPRPTGADQVHAKTSAARFCITLLRTRQDLRRRFPRALSAGLDGDFARWLQTEGALELGLSSKACGHIADLFASDPAARVRQVRLIRTRVANDHPLAMLRAGAGDFLAWGVREGIRKEELSLEGLWWFLISADETPARSVVDTYLFTPSWQRFFPDGVTVFGCHALSAWLESSFGVPADWIGLSDALDRLTPAEQIRIAYHADPAWQERHPAPFVSRDAASKLLAWLATPAAGLRQAPVVWLGQQDPKALAIALAAPGLNMLGHFCYASGLRTSTESLVEGYRINGGSVSERDVWVQERGDDNRHIDYAGLEIYDVTIIHTQPEPLFDVAFERGGLAPRSPRTYRIGYWYWELDTIPAHWQKQADEVDEIWTATKFVGDALRERFDVPVRVIMPGLEHPVFEPLPRSRFELPDETFLFLFTFHMASIMERKNPLGLIAAFIEAFGNDRTVGLVLKTSFGHLYPDQLTELRDASAGYNVIIIDDVYTKEEVLALMDACDSYVSLHRSEGYGLTMAEAMLLGKPVIATNYSGNLEFMSNDTSLLVDYDLVTLDREYPPYKAGMRWAHASTSHAAQCMRKVRDNPEWARQLGAKAKADLTIRMSFATTGKKIHDRISEIRALRNSLERRA